MACMMEGISSEAASLAGRKLDNLCWIYDSNRITIEGSTDLAFTEDVAGRFMAYGWNVLRVSDANDLDRLQLAFKQFYATKNRPTLIIVSSHIGYGSPHKQGTSGVHGEPLGPDEVKLTKKAYGWPEDAQFLVPDGVYEHFANGIGKRGADLHAAWKDLLKKYEAQFPEEGKQLHAIQTRELPEGWEKALPTFPADPKGMAGRDVSNKIENAVGPKIPWLIGGSADLTPSTKTRLTFEGAGDFQAGSYGGRNIPLGIHR